MKWPTIRARIRRMEALSLGFQSEYDLFERGAVPLKMPERREYLARLTGIQHAIEEARIVLVKAGQLHEGGPAM